MPSSLLSPLTSSRYHLSCNDCLGDRREDYQNCSVLYCVVCTTVVQLHTYVNSSYRAVLGPGDLVLDI